MSQSRGDCVWMCVGGCVCVFVRVDVWVRSVKLINKVMRKDGYSY